MDKWWTEGVDKREGVEILKKCVNEVGLSELYPTLRGLGDSELMDQGSTIKFKFNCILIDASGIHQINLSSSDPISEMEAAGKAADVVTPNPPVDVGVTAAVA